MKTIELNKRIFLFPESWNELTGRQLVGVMEVFDSPAEVTQARLRLFKLLGGFTAWQWLWLKAAQLHDLLYLTDFLVQENTLTQNLLPSYKGFFGPAADFENLKMSEFAYSEGYYLGWKAEESNDKLLDKLVAVLYRPKKKGYDLKRNKDGDARQPFNENLSHYYATATIYYWPRALKLAIAHFYEACREKLIRDFPDVFNGASGEPAKYGLLDIMQGVAEENTFGTFKDVEEQYVRLVMVKMDRAVQAGKQLKNLQTT